MLLNPGSDIILCVLFYLKDPEPMRYHFHGRKIIVPAFSLESDCCGSALRFPGCILLLLCLLPFHCPPLQADLGKGGYRNSVRSKKGIKKPLPAANKTDCNRFCLCSAVLEQTMVFTHIYRRNQAMDSRKLSVYVNGWNTLSVLRLSLPSMISPHF